LEIEKIIGPDNQRDNTRTSKGITYYQPVVYIRRRLVDYKNLGVLENRSNQTKQLLLANTQV
jgi:hypothetical protein